MIYVLIKSCRLEFCLSASCLVHLRCTSDPRLIKSKLDVRSLIRSHWGNILKPLTQLWKTCPSFHLSVEHISSSESLSYAIRRTGGWLRSQETSFCTGSSCEPGSAVAVCSAVALGTVVEDCWSGGISDLCSGF